MYLRPYTYGSENAMEWEKLKEQYLYTPIRG